MLLCAEGYNLSLCFLHGISSRIITLVFKVPRGRKPFYTWWCCAYRRWCCEYRQILTILCSDSPGSRIFTVDLQGPKGSEHLPPVVLLHGFGMGLGFWARQLDHISKHRRVIAIDLPGMGCSEQPSVFNLLVITMIQHNYAGLRSRCLEAMFNGIPPSAFFSMSRLRIITNVKILYHLFNV